MRRLVGLCLVLLLTACGVPWRDTAPPPPSGEVLPPPVTAPPVKPPLPPPGPRVLKLNPRPDEGWVLEPTPESQVGDDVLGSPLGVWWIAPDRALVRWIWPDMQSEILLADLGAGTLTPMPMYADIRSISPDGRYVTNHPRGQFRAILMEAATGKEIHAFGPAVMQETWLSPDLLHVAYENDRADLYNLTTGKVTELGRSLRPVLVGGRDVCYRTHQPQEVTCTTLDGELTRSLTPGTARDVHHLPDGYAVDPTGRRMAFVYARDRVSWQWGSAANASSPALYSRVDMLGIYDASSGAVERYVLPRAGIPTNLVWSADGAWLGLGLGQMEGKGLAVRPKGPTDFWTVEVATGKRTAVGSATGQYPVPPLLKVFPGGSLVYLPGPDDQPNLLTPGGKPVPWRPGTTLLAQSLWEPEGRVLAFQGAGKVEVYNAGGESQTWNWEGGSRHDIAIPGPGLAWAAIHANRPGRVLFLVADLG